MVKLIEGDIFDAAPDMWLCHQCNATTRSPKGRGLSADMFARFPYANVYSTREHLNKVGKTIVKKGPRVVCNMVAQRSPGKPRKKNDTPEMREQWFIKCLCDIYHQGGTKLAFPYGVGSGLAGGKWENYEEMLDSFEKESGVDIYVFRKK